VGCGPNQWCKVIVGADNSCEPKGDDGTPCVWDVECASGKCGAGFCDDPCGVDADCDPSEFCEPSDKFCKSEYPVGWTGCLADNQCQSGHCLGVALQCVECEEHADCPATTFCNGLFECELKKDNGQACLTDAQCTSGLCDLNCVDCKDDAHCPPGWYCDATFGELNSCEPKIDLGGACTSDEQCASGKCGEGACHTPCTSDSQCPSTAFCEPLGDFCKPKLANGTGVGCTADTQCLSGHCIEIGLSCVQCEAHDACGSDHYCDGNLTCKTKVGLGGTCTSDDQCSSGECGEGKCQTPCTSDGQCPSTAFCEPLGKFCKPKFPSGTGVGCTADTQCLSGHCIEIGLSCVQCESSAHCASSQFCNGLFQCEAKLPLGATCTQDSSCQSGHCTDIGLTCVQCEMNDHCGSGQFCNVLNQCVALLPTGAGCLTNAACASGICDVGTCVDCLQHSHCASTEYCNIILGTNTCKPRQGAGSACTEHFQCLSNSCNACTETGIFGNCIAWACN
jgi:hypothetical protein